MLGIFGLFKMCLFAYKSVIYFGFFKRKISKKKVFFFFDSLTGSGYPLVGLGLPYSVVGLCPVVSDSLQPQRLLCLHGILQARTLEWVTISPSRGPSGPREALLRCRRALYRPATREAPLDDSHGNYLLGDTPLRSISSGSFPLATSYFSSWVSIAVL